MVTKKLSEHSVEELKFFNDPGDIENTNLDMRVAYAHDQLFWLKNKQQEINVKIKAFDDWYEGIDKPE